MDERTGARAARAPSGMPVAHTLTGAYVLDAVSAAERVVFERHLSACEACTRDVAELRATATRLGLAASVHVPPGLRDVVLAEIHRVPQQRPRGGRSASRVRSGAARVPAVAAAVLLAVTVTLAWLAARVQDDRNATREQLAAMTDVLRSADHQIRHEDVRSGGAITVVVSHDRDRALVLPELPPPSGEHTYQAWLFGERVRSAGLIGDVAFLAVSGLGESDRIVVTVEPAGGSPRPTTPPIVQVALP